MLGDMLCATPALRSLRAGFPQARITLVGMPWARELAQRLDSIDDFIAFPGYPGLPESRYDMCDVANFLIDMRSRRFDLAVQLHGSGGVTNPLVALFGARSCAGFCGNPESLPQGQDWSCIPWPRHGHEIERLLALTDHLGLPRQGLGLDYPLREKDREALALLWPGAFESRPYVCVHAGAQLPSRRWPLERFAAVADEIAGSGRTVVLTGGPGEIEVAEALTTCMNERAVNLAGRTSLWTLGALIEGAESVICNDTGISHIAAALRRPSVVVSCGAEVARWRPIDAERHRVLWREVPCRPCAYPTCPYDHACAHGVGVDEVLAAWWHTVATEHADA